MADDDDRQQDRNAASAFLDGVSVLAPSVGGPAGLVLALAIQLAAPFLIDSIRSHRERQAEAFATALANAVAKHADVLERAGEPAVDALVASLAAYAVEGREKLQAQLIAELLVHGLAEDASPDDIDQLARVVGSLSASERKAIAILVTHREDPGSPYLNVMPEVVLRDDVGMSPPAAAAAAGHLRSLGVLTDVAVYGGSMVGLSKLADQLVEVFASLEEV